MAQVSGVLADPVPTVAVEGWEQDTIRTSVLFWIPSTDDSAKMRTVVTQAVLDAARHAGLDVHSAAQSVVVRQSPGTGMS